MILIVSQRYNDLVTDLVVDWLSYKKANFLRINGYDLLLDINFSTDLENFTLTKEKISSNDINVIWYRRWYNSNMFPKEYSTISEFKDSDKVIDYVKDEFRGFKEFFFESLRDKKWIHRPPYLRQNVVEKPLELKIATKHGLNIPKTLACNNKEALLLFRKNLGKELIIKNLKTVGVFPHTSLFKKPVATYTQSLSLEEINALPKRFTPILVQEKIEKLFEIRVFYFNSKCYSMCIFSQVEKKTSVDFRNYSTDMKQRMIPYKLPQEIEIKIKLFMSEVGLETGSIDMIYAKDSNYYFLEVNPEGQFGMVSLPCNYYIEKEIAKELIKQDKK
ncbi:grasp-with-spasm system ATP-grasp peptide maturase [Tenacibaculum maritimum]|uniref:grasp-with-spasm system ATP-grasp peptide maturase n=1 Tax=Tenacibaculum maritimum TaxID=107401 RepID=UPI003877055E